MPRGLFFARAGVAPDPEDFGQRLWSIVRADDVRKAAVAFAARPWVVCGDVVTVVDADSQLYVLEVIGDDARIVSQRETNDWLMAGRWR